MIFPSIRLLRKASASSRNNTHPPFSRQIEKKKKLKIMIQLPGITSSKTTAGKQQQDRCVGMISSSKLKDRVDAPYSGFLVINSNEHLQLCLPLSFICSRLVYNLDVMCVKPHDTRGQTAAIHFFYGGHESLEDPTSNTISVLNSLLTQLLLPFLNLDLTSFIKLTEFQSTDVNAIRNIFSICSQSRATHGFRLHYH